MKIFPCVLASCFVGLATLAEPVITDVRVRQQWPWDTKVYIDYDIAGVDATAPQDVVVTAYSGETLLGELPSASLRGGRYSIAKDGTYRIVFDPSRSGLTARGNLPEFNVELSLTPSTPDSEILYKILDVTTGRMTDVSRAELLDGNYGAVETNFTFVGRTDLSNVLIWTGVTNDVAYKTTQMVFRKIPAGTFLMGSPDDDSEPSRNGERETQHRVQLTKDYYMGVFRLTFAQWKMIQSELPATGEKTKALYADSNNNLRAAQSMNYGALRGNYGAQPSQGGNWPSDGHRVSPNSYLGRLRAVIAESGYVVDLPTEAQWEYACRAGTMGPLYDGQPGSTSTRTARIFYANGDVGRRLPNAYGLYDILSSGSCGEVMLDYSALKFGMVPDAELTVDPVGGTAAEAYPDYPRVLRGGNDRIACRNFITVGFWNEAYTCRLALHPEVEGEVAATADADLVSAPRSARTRVCFDTRTNPSWRTLFAPTQSGALALDWPHAATGATLTLTRDGVPQTYTLTDKTACTYSLPAFGEPSGAEGERVCEVSIAYDSGLVRTAMFGIVQGTGVRSRVPIILSSDDRAWTRAGKRRVLPVAAGTTQVSVNGTDLPVAALNGEAGWVDWTPAMDTSVLTRVVDGVAESATLFRFPDGTLLIIR